MARSTPFEKAERDWQKCYKDWWKEFGIPVTGLKSDDLYWRQFGLKILHTNPESLASMFLVMIFDEKRNRAQMSLNRLRSHYKNTHPALALHWGRKPVGRKHSLDDKDNVSIALAARFGMRKAKILKLLGRPSDSSNASQYQWLDRAVRKGESCSQFSREESKLRKMAPDARNQKIFKLLTQIKPPDSPDLSTS